jgi:hypothetical protein
MENLTNGAQHFDVQFEQPEKTKERKSKEENF